MMRGYLPRLLLLAAIWGASYLFIKVAVDEVAPSAMMAVRALGAGLILLVFLVSTRGATESIAGLRSSWRQAVVLGIFNAALPFWLIAWGEQHIDSGVAGIAQATVPLFAFLLGLRFLPHEHVAAVRWVGVAVGLGGVAVLAGVDPLSGWWGAAGTLAIVLSSLSYASSGVYAQLRVADTPGPVLATGSMIAGGLVLLPFALFELPDALPGWEALASLAALTVLGTALAQLVLFDTIHLFGMRRLSLVTYLMPGFAILYGAVLLSEPVTAAMVAALGLILLGVALGSGVVAGVRVRRTTGDAV